MSGKRWGLWLRVVKSLWVVISMRQCRILEPWHSCKLVLAPEIYPTLYRKVPEGCTNLCHACLW